MFKFKKKRNMTLELVEGAIEDCAGRMLELDSESEEYAKVNEQMIKLISTETTLKSTGKISPEVWATIIANLVGILLILNYERVNVIATKAFSHIAKLRM